MDYKTLHSLGQDCSLISQEITGTTAVLYQVIKGGTVELETLDRHKAVIKYKALVKSVLRMIREELTSL